MPGLIQNKPAVFILDSGGPTVFYKSKAAPKEMIRCTIGIIQIMAPVDDGGKGPSNLETIRRLAADRLHNPNLLLGILGEDFFGAFAVGLDFSNSKATFWDDGYPSGKAALRWIGENPYAFQIIVRKGEIGVLARVGSTDMALCIDTGASTSGIWPSIARKVQGKDGPPSTINYWNGPRTVRSRIVPTLKLGTLTLNNVAFSLDPDPSEVADKSNMDGVLSLNDLHATKAFFDVPEKFFAIQRSKSP